MSCRQFITLARESEPPGAILSAQHVDHGSGAKRLELLHEMIPTAKVITAPVNPTSPNLAEIQSRDLQAAARSLGLQLQVLQASTDDDFGSDIYTRDRIGIARPCDRLRRVFL